MSKKFIISLLSFVSITTIAQGGSLVLIADLSDENKRVVCQKLIDPYEEFRQKNSSFIEPQNETFSYPILKPLEKMHYQNVLFDEVNDEIAETLASILLKNAPKNK